MSYFVPLHAAPRFGHQSSFALITSDDRDDQLEYINGVVKFVTFVLYLLICWALALVVLKVMGKNRIGCAAGGDVIDIRAMKREVGKDKVKAILRRSWKLQAGLFLATIAIPICTGLFLTRGLEIFTTSLDQIKVTNEDVEAIVHRAIQITSSMKETQEQLHRAKLHLIKAVESLCSEYEGSWPMQVVPTNITSALVVLDTFIEHNVDYAQQSLPQIVEITESIERTITSITENDWTIKMILMVLNVINCFFFTGVILARNNIVHYPYRFMVAYFLFPLFMVVGILIACFFLPIGFGATLNADLCSGGQSENLSGAEGTIEDIIMIHGILETDMIYQLFTYYSSGCVSDNPMEIAALSVDQLNILIRDVTNLALRLDTEGFDQCGGNPSNVVARTHNVADHLVKFRASLSSALQLSDCSNLSPVIQQAIDGEICTNTLVGSTWMFFSCLSLLVVCMIIVSIRAGLYNVAVKTEKRRDKAQEWEWEEYKRFMEPFYPDSRQWKYFPSPSKDDEKALKLGSRSSFETASTGKPSDEDVQSDDIELSSGYSYNEKNEIIRRCPDASALAGKEWKRTPLRKRVPPTSTEKIRNRSPGAMISRTRQPLSSKDTNSRSIDNIPDAPAKRKRAVARTANSLENHSTQ